MGALWARLTGRLGGMSAHSRAGLFGIGWTGLAQFTGMAVRLASNLILTRLLAPTDYGILGAAMAVVTTLELLSDLGILPSLVRHPKGDQPEFLITGWWMALGRALLLFVLGGTLAWPVAEFNRQPELFPVLLVLALRPALLALHSPGMPLLRRQLNYRALFCDEVGQTLVGTITSLLLAWWLRSVWAIVGGTLAGAAAGVLISYWLAPMRPRFLWSALASQEIGHLGKQVFVNTLVMALWLNIDRLLGLRYVTPVEMGLYAVAFNLAAVLETLMTRACDVYFSMLARAEDSEKQVAWHRHICDRAAWWLMPLLAAGVVTAPLVIRILYDPRYIGAGILFGLMVARLLTRGLGQLQFQYLLARADVGPATRAYVVALVVQVALLFPLVWNFGVVGLAVASLISTIVLTFWQSLFLWNRGLGSFTPFSVSVAWTGMAVAILFLLA